MLQTILALTCCDRQRSALKVIASKSRWRLYFARDSREAERHLQEEPIGIILCDRDLPGMDWRDQIGSLLRSTPRSCIILVSGVNDEYLWEEVIRNGGYDVLPKPLQETQVVLAVTGASWYWKRYRARI